MADLESLKTRMQFALDAIRTHEAHGARPEFLNALIGSFEAGLDIAQNMGAMSECFEVGRFEDAMQVIAVLRYHVRKLDALVSDAQSNAIRLRTLEWIAEAEKGGSK